MRNFSFVLSLFFLNFNCFSQNVGWQLIPSSNTRTLQDIFFTDSGNGWAVGYNGTILKTIDGGESWTNQTSGTGTILTAVFFLNSQLGWVVGYNGTILKTIDGGQNWQSLTNSSITFAITDVYFINSQTGFITGQTSGKVYQTNDGGQNWIATTGGGNLSDCTVYGINFVNAQDGWAACGCGEIRKTNNGGQSWAKIQNSTTTVGNNLYGIFFINSQTGWAVGGFNDAVIIKTTNAGVSWQKTVIPDHSFRSVFFTDSQNGWVVGNSGLIVMTSDAGQTWVTQETNSTSFFWSVYFANSDLGWAVAGSKIYKTTNGGVVSNRSIVSNPTFSLYPNPAEESIQLQVKGDIISVNVTDAVGRTVKTGQALPLTDKRLDIRNLHPGMYWVKIQTTEGVAMQKLVKK